MAVGDPCRAAMSRTASVARVPSPRPRAAGIVPTFVTKAWPPARKTDAQAAGTPASRTTTWRSGSARIDEGQAVELRPGIRPAVVRPAIGAAPSPPGSRPARPRPRPPRRRRSRLPDRPRTIPAQSRRSRTMPYSGSASVNPRAASRRSRSTGVVDGPSHHVVGTEPRSRRRRVELVDPRLDRGVVTRELGAEHVVEALERTPAGDPRGVRLDRDGRPGQARDRRECRDEGRLRLGQAGRAPAASTTVCETA